MACSKLALLAFCSIKIPSATLLSTAVSFSTCSSASLRLLSKGAFSNRIGSFPVSMSRALAVLAIAEVYQKPDI